MAEPFEVGGVVVRVRVVADDVQQALNKVVSAIQNMGKTWQQVSNELEQAAEQTRSLTQATQQASSATAAIGKSSGDLDKYETKLEKLNAQYDLQNRKVLQLQESLDSMVQQYAALQAATGGNMDFMPEDVAPDLTARYDAELAKLDALRNSIRQTEQARTEAAAKLQAQQNAAIQKQEQLNQKLADKRSTNNTKIGMNTAAAAIRTVSNAAGGAVGNIGYLASEIVYLKEQMHLAESGAASLAVGISGGIMMAVTLISTIASQISQAQAQELQAAKDAAAAYQVVNEETATAQRNLAVLQDQTSTTAEVRDAKEALAQQFPDLVAGWDEEGNAILANNEAIKAQIEYLQQLDDAKQSAAAASVGTLTDDMNKQIKEISALNYLYNTEFSEMARPSIESAGAAAYGFFGKAFKNLYDKDAIKEDLTNAQVEFRENIQDYEQAIIAAINERTGGTEVSSAMSSYISNILNQLANGTAWADGLGIEWEELPDDIVQQIIDQYNATLEKIPDEIKDLIDNLDVDMQPAYASLFEKLQGGEISMDDFSTAIRTLSSEGLQDTITEFETLHDKITDFTATDQDVDRYNQLLVQLRDTGKLDADTFGTLSDATMESAEALREAAIDTEAAKSSYLDMAKSVNDAYSSLKSFRDDLSDIGQLEAVKQALDAGAGTKDYADALEYLSQEYGVTKEEAAGMAGQLQNEIQLKKDIAAASIIQARVEAQTQIAVVEAMRSMGKVTEEQATTMINALNGVIGKYDQLLNASGELNESQIKITMPEISGSSSAASSVNEALQEQLDLLSHKKNMDALTYDAEIAWLRRIRDQYVQTNEEYRDLTEQIYTAEKQRENALLEYKKSMDRLTLQEEIRSIEAQVQQYAQGAQARMDLEVELHQLKISLADSELEYLKAMNQLTLQEELSALEKQRSFYAEGTESRKQLEREIYQLRLNLMDSTLEHQKAMGQLSLEEEKGILERRLKLFKQGTEAYNQVEEQLYEVNQQIREQNAEKIDAIADGVIEALTNRYEQMRDAELQQLQDSADAWDAWAKEQNDAIQEQIDALDELAEAEDREKEEAEKLRNISSLEQQIAYASDDYNKLQLQKQLDAAREELEEWRKENEREDLKDELEAQKDAVNEAAEAQKEAIKKQQEEIEKEYEELLKEKNIQAEAEKLLLEGNQNEIINLLKSYAPEYEIVGQTLGEKLVDGFEQTIGQGLSYWYDRIRAPFADYQARLAAAATQAADAFLSGRQNGAGGPKTETPPSVVVNVEFNEPVESPTEISRALKRTMEQAYRQFTN